MALSGLAGDTPRYVTVYCHNKSYSSTASGFNFIGAPYFPPTNADDAKHEDHNLISAAKIKVSGDYNKDGVSVVIDASKLEIPNALYGGERNVGLVEICLECVRMVAQKVDRKITDLKIIAPDGLDNELEAMKKRFLDSDMTKRFSHHPGDDGFGWKPSD
ncbi:MAG: hypothetical protein AAF585_11235 [Verrucomicrobiota bacterium]